MAREVGDGLSGLLSLSGLSGGQITAILDEAQHHIDRRESQNDVSGPGREMPGSGMTVATLFFEPSTRTRLSFELAARRLGADVVTFLPEGSSTEKGETLRDTVRTIAAMGADVLVVRHELADAPDWVSRWTGRPVVNAGAGRREHPTQTLADALTLRQHFGDLAGLKMGIVGDVGNSRVARGHMLALPKLGMDLTLIGPTSLLPPANPWDLRLSNSLDDELGELDVVYLLRVQRERGALGSFPSENEYARRFGLGRERLSMLKPTTMIMHPGPLNRGVEIDDETADGERSLVLAQVANGVPVRMAVLAGAMRSEP
ncbi:MAG: aspartate carbamoyltransferase catalytic subunit [Acidimicrobiia bacterium]